MTWCPSHKELVYVKGTRVEDFIGRVKHIRRPQIEGKYGEKLPDTTRWNAVNVIVVVRGHGVVHVDRFHYQVGQMVHMPANRIFPVSAAPKYLLNALYVRNMLD